MMRTLSSRNYRLKVAALLLGAIAIFSTMPMAIAQDPMEKPVSPLVAQCNVVSHLIYDAGIAMSAYSVKMAPEHAEKYSKIRAEIPKALAKLKEVAGSGKDREEAFKNVETTCLNGIKMLDAAKTTIDKSSEKETAQFRARHMCKDIRSLADEVQSGLFALTKT